MKKPMNDGFFSVAAKVRQKLNQNFICAFLIAFGKTCKNMATVKVYRIITVLIR